MTVARPSDGPTDSSRRSRGADPALEHETNKITEDDRQARRARLRRPGASTDHDMTLYHFDLRGLVRVQLLTYVDMSEWKVSIVLLSANAL